LLAVEIKGINNSTRVVKFSFNELTLFKVSNTIKAYELDQTLLCKHLYYVQAAILCVKKAVWPRNPKKHWQWEGHNFGSLVKLFTIT